MRVSAVIPKDSKLMIVGEAPGEQEDMMGVPFFGYAGQELNRMLKEAGTERSKVALTNVFDERPGLDNSLANWAMPKKEWQAKCKAMNVVIPSFGKDLYLDPAIVVPALERLQGEVEKGAPNIVVALGATALTALTNLSGITKARGAVLRTLPRFGSRKFLATYHPAYILRSWSERSIAVADLAKAVRESEYPDVRRRERIIYVPETLDDIRWFDETYLAPSPVFTFDIETSHGQITAISFAPNPDHGLCIPLWNKDKPDWSHWSEVDELWIVHWIRRQMLSEKRKRAQNGLYDIQYIRWLFGVIPVNYLDDTMILHHAMYSELPKDLGFLASVYVNEINWKVLNPRGRDKFKRDE